MKRIFVCFKGLLIALVGRWFTFYCHFFTIGWRSGDRELQSDPTTRGISIPNHFPKSSKKNAMLQVVVVVVVVSYPTYQILADIFLRLFSLLVAALQRVDRLLQCLHQLLGAFLRLAEQGHLGASGCFTMAETFTFTKPPPGQPKQRTAEPEITNRLTRVCCCAHVFGAVMICVHSCSMHNDKTARTRTTTTFHTLSTICVW